MRVFKYLLVFGLFPGVLAGQVKFEAESRLREAEVPAQAVTFLQEAQLDAKVRWYFEENLEGNSVEAKFMLQKHRYSVEFDTIGHIQDIEVEIDFVALDLSLQQAIIITLDSLFQRHKVRKIQKHFSGDSTFLASLLQAPDLPQQNGLFYELIVKGKQNRTTALFELSIDNEGTLLTQKHILFRNATHLEY